MLSLYLFQCLDLDTSPELNNQNRIPSTSMSESPSIANIQNKQNRDQQYLAVRAQQNSRNSNSVDSGSFKAEGNGKLCLSLSMFQQLWCQHGSSYIFDRSLTLGQ